MTHKKDRWAFPVFPAIAPAGAQTAYFSYFGVYAAGYEVSAQVLMPASRIRAITINITANTLGTASTITLQRNAAATTLTGTIGVGAVGRLIFEGDVTFAKGDLMAIEIVIGGTAAQSITIRGGSIIAESD